MRLPTFYPLSQEIDDFLAVLLQVGDLVIAWGIQVMAVTAVIAIVVKDHNGLPRNLLDDARPLPDVAVEGGGLFGYLVVLLEKKYRTQVSPSANFSKIQFQSETLYIYAHLFSRVEKSSRGGSEGLCVRWGKQITRDPGSY